MGAVATPNLHGKFDQVTVRHFIARDVVEDAQGLRSRAIGRLEKLAFLIQNLPVSVVNIEEIPVHCELAANVTCKSPRRIEVPSLLALWEKIHQTVAVTSFGNGGRTLPRRWGPFVNKPQDHEMLEPLFMQLEQHDVVSDAERALLAETISIGRDFAVGQDLVSAGSRPSYSTLLVEGLAARYKVLEDGGRQFTALQQLHS